MTSKAAQILTRHQKWFTPLVWVLTTLLASYILARFVFPEVETESRMFGLQKVNHYSFNSRVFFFSNAISLSVLVVGSLVLLIQKARQFLYWLAERFFLSLWFIIPLTMTSGCFYVLGLTKSLFISEQFFVQREVTLLNSIRLLFENDENFLGTIIFMFTIVFPILKYILLFTSLLFRQRDWINKLNSWLSMISKWSMLDVYIVAVLLLNMKFESKIVNMELKSGIIWFSLSIILIMVAMLIQGRNNQQQK